MTTRLTFVIFAATASATASGCGGSSDPADDACDDGHVRSDGECVVCPLDCPDGRYSTCAGEIEVDEVCAACTPIDGCAEVACLNDHDQACAICDEGFALVDGACLVPPTVASTDPVDGRVGVGTGRTLEIVFSEAMVAGSLVAQSTAGPCSGAVQLQVGPEFTDCVGGAVASADGATYTFTPESLADDTRYRLIVTTAATAATAAPLASDHVTAFTTTRFADDARVIYRSDPVSGGFGGATGADAVCDASRPPGVAAAKAILGTTTRTACTIANCGDGSTSSDWVLAPDVRYVRADGAFLFTTNGDAIFTDYPMGASLADQGVNTWSGLMADWTTGSPNCDDWTTASADEPGRVGWDLGTDAFWLQGGQLPCSDHKPLACAEQAPPAP